MTAAKTVISKIRGWFPQETILPKKIRALQQPTKKRNIIKIGVAGIILASILITTIFSITLLQSVNQVPLQELYGSGNMINTNANITDFTAVQADGYFRIYINKSNTYYCNIRSDDNLTSYFLINQTGNTVSIRLKPDYYLVLRPIEIQIGMPDIEKVQCSNIAQVFAIGFNLTHPFQVNLSGFSRFGMHGQAPNLTVTCSKSTFAFGNVTNAKVDMSGGIGDMTIYGRLDANLNDHAKLYYKGTPTLGFINTWGGAQLSKIKYDITTP